MSQHRDPAPPDALLPRALPAAQVTASIEKDPWRVVEKERDLKGRGGGESPQVLVYPEWELVVEPEADTLVVRPCSAPCMGTLPHSGSPNTPALSRDERHLF